MHHIHLLFDSPLCARFFFTSPRGGFRLDDGNPTWTDLSSAAEWLTGKSSSGGARLAHEFGLIRTIE